MNHPNRVLVVDDDDAARHATVRILGRAGYEVIEAPDGQSALDLVESSRPALVLLDLVLPDMKGTDVLQRIHRKMNGQRPAIVLFSASHVGQEATVNGLEAGADGYLARPFGARELLAHVGVHIRQAELTAELRASEARYRDLIAGQPDGMLVVDADGLIRFVNPAAERLFSRSTAQLSGVPFGYPVDGVQIPELEVRRDDGETAFVEMRASSTRWDGGDAFVVSLRDVSARRHAETVLVARARQQEAIARLSLTASGTEGICSVIAMAEEQAAAGLGDVDVRVVSAFPPTRNAPDVTLQAIAGPGGAAGVVELPILVHGETWGALVVEPGAGRSIGADDRKFLEALANVLAVAVDRFATEKKLRVGDERFHLLANATNDAIWDWDLVTGETWGNEGFETLFGEALDAHGLSVDIWSSRVHPDDRERVAGHLRAALAAGASRWTDEYRYRRADGTYAFVLDRGSVIRDATGTAVRMVGGMADITERRRAEDMLREQATLLDEASDAIIVKDLDRRIRYWNKRAERVYGWTAAEAVGQRERDLLYVDATASDEAARAVIEHGEWTGELEHVTCDGLTLAIEARWTLVCDEHGQPRSILAINTDVTQRKRLERQYLRAQRLESIGTLAGGIAHDLNNVLAPVVLSVDLLRGMIDDPVGLEILETVGQSATRGAEMVGQVLSFARGLEGQRVEVRVADVVRDVAKIATETFPKNIRLDVESARELWGLKADATQLHQVLLNLLVNARDAMPMGGDLAIRAANIHIDEQYAGMNIEARPGPYVRIEVQDTGTGISRADLDKIFDPFFTTKEPGRGTGLGLSTSLAIVKGHGGFLRVYSEPGRGTRFRVYLPAAGVAATDGVACAQAVRDRGQGETVLVIDDEAPIRAITKQTLEAHGYRVITAVDGSQGVATFAQYPGGIDLVLTDMMMPVMDGPATVRAIRQLDPDVTIIGATGLASSSGAASLRELGVSSVLAKPYTADTLLLAVADCLRERRQPGCPHGERRATRH